MAQISSTTTHVNLLQLWLHGKHNSLNCSYSEECCFTITFLYFSPCSCLNYLWFSIIVILYLFTMLIEEIWTYGKRLRSTPCRDDIYTHINDNHKYLVDSWTYLYISDVVISSLYNTWNPSNFVILQIEFSTTFVLLLNNRGREI